MLATRATTRQRRQFGRTIGTNQALRHILADMYVRGASAWSTVLYAAAALDDDPPRPTRPQSIAKAYVAPGRREVAHGTMQVFGGIAFTEEHEAHRYLRRIIVRELAIRRRRAPRAELGRALAKAPPRAKVWNGSAGYDTTRGTGFNDPTAQRLEAHQRRAPSRSSSARCSPRSCTTRAGGDCDAAVIAGGRST